MKFLQRPSKTKAKKKKTKQEGVVPSVKSSSSKKNFLGVEETAPPDAPPSTLDFQPIVIDNNGNNGNQQEQESAPSLSRPVSPPNLTKFNLVAAATAAATAIGNDEGVGNYGKASGVRNDQHFGGKAGVEAEEPGVFDLGGLPMCSSDSVDEMFEDQQSHDYNSVVQHVNSEAHPLEPPRLPIIATTGRAASSDLPTQRTLAPTTTLTPHLDAALYKQHPPAPLMELSGAPGTESGNSTSAFGGPPCIEVMIDPTGVPPSPLRESQLDFPPLDHNNTDDPLLTSVDNYRKDTSSSPVVADGLGAPLGDIGMKTQLWDAQRLVRVVLGKPQANTQPLESGSILQAIRAFALMKQELISLRKQQERRDHDPPAIMEGLDTPTTSGGGLTPAGSSCVQQQSSSSFRNFNRLKNSPARPSSSRASPSSSVSSFGKEGEISASGKSSSVSKKAIAEAAKRIQYLERQLQNATVTIHKLQHQNTENHIKELEQSKLDAQRQLARTKAEMGAMEVRFKIASEECAMKDRKYSELLQKFGQFTEFKNRELDSAVAAKDTEIANLQKQLADALAGGNNGSSTLTSSTSCDVKEAVATAWGDDDTSQDWKAEQQALREELEKARLEIRKKDEVIHDLEKSQETLPRQVPISAAVAATTDENSLTSSSLSSSAAAKQHRKNSEEGVTNILKEVLKENQSASSKTKTTTSVRGGTTTAAPPPPPTVGSSQSSSNKSSISSQRMRSLQEEHKALVASIQMLEEEMKLEYAC